MQFFYLEFLFLFLNHIYNLLILFSKKLNIFVVWVFRARYARKYGVY